MSAWDEEVDRLRGAFVAVFGRGVRPFGSLAMGWMGFSDGSEGVQWNALVERESLRWGIGVNLEGIKYDGWPISRLIARELEDPTLLEVIKDVAGRDRITLHFSRDFWQVSARPAIVEGAIAPTPIPLDRLRSEDWRQALLGARSCLDARKNYQGRATQEVTLAVSGRKVQGEVSPHLQFRETLPIVAHVRSDREAAMREARKKLEPVYRFVERRSAPVLP